MLQDNPAHLWNSFEVIIVTTGLCGILAWNCIPARFAMGRLLVQILFFFAMSALLPMSGIVPYETSGDKHVTSRLIITSAVKLFWWLHLNWAIIGFVRIYLVIEHRPKEARLLQDIVVGAVYVGTTLSILAFVFAVPVGALLATSGIAAIVLGLALQNTLGDLFSGVALKLGRSFALGDWIALSDGTEGKVLETNWRSAHLRTQSNNILVLPNSLLAKIQLTNLSALDESQSLSMNVRLTTTKRPAAIIALLNEVLASCNLVLDRPEPSAHVKSVDSLTMELELAFTVARIDDRAKAKNEIFDLVYRYAKVGGFSLSQPQNTLICGAFASHQEPDIEPVDFAGLLELVLPFSDLTKNERDALAVTAKSRSYAKGELISQEGDELASLMIVKAGAVVRNWNDAIDFQHTALLAPGDFFGGQGVLLSGSVQGTYRARNHVVICEIDREALVSLIDRRPELPERFTRMALNEMTKIVDQASHRPSATKSALRKAIRFAFHHHSHSRLP